MADDDDSVDTFDSTSDDEVNNSETHNNADKQQQSNKSGVGTIGGIKGKLRSAKRASIDAGHNLKEALVTATHGVMDKVKEVKHAAKDLGESAVEKYHEIADDLSGAKRRRDSSGSKNHQSTDHTSEGDVKPATSSDADECAAHVKCVAQTQQKEASGDGQVIDNQSGPLNSSGGKSEHFAKPDRSKHKETDDRPVLEDWMILQQ